MIVDVTLNTLKRVAKGTQELLLCEKPTTIDLYYVNQSPAIFRCILKKPEDQTNYNILIQSLPKFIKVLNVTTEADIANVLLMQLKQNGIQPTVKS